MEINDCYARHFLLHFIHAGSSILAQQSCSCTYTERPTKLGILFVCTVREMIFLYKYLPYTFTRRRQNVLNKCFENIFFKLTYVFVIIRFFFAVHSLQINIKSICKCLHSAVLSHKTLNVIMYRENEKEFCVHRPPYECVLLLCVVALQTDNLWSVKGGTAALSVL